MDKHTTLNSPAMAYIRALYAPEDALLSRIRETLEARNEAIQVGPEEGRILQVLMQAANVKTVVEIGTLAGYSAIWMARALPEGGMVHGLEKDPERAAMANAFLAQSDVAHRVRIHIGDALDILPTLKGPFDMVFIDADKPGYNAYLDWAEKNIRPGGLVVADNTLLFGAAPMASPPPDCAPATWEAMRRFNARLADPKQYAGVMLPTEQGLSVAVKLT